MPADPLRAIAFVDPHIHLWKRTALRYPWLSPPFTPASLMGSVEPIAADYTIAHYRADAAAFNPIAAVHIDAGAHPEDARAETEFLSAHATESNFPLAIVAFAELQHPTAEAQLAAQAANPRVRGIRQILNWHPDPYFSYTASNLLENPAWRHGFAALARHRLSFDLQAYPHQCAAAARLFARHPEIPVIVNHAGMPLTTRPNAHAEWRTAMRHLAALPHIAVKISGFGIVDHAWSAASIRPYVRDVIDMFGPQRCMVASDFPTDKLYASFADTLGAYVALTQDLSESDRRDLFGRTANKIYRLGLTL
jgi:predicted TIM-barrel fold metal-dependent hydrolase